MSRPFILASSSPRRRALLASLGIEFSIIKPQIDETRHPGEAPLELVSRLSREKALDVVARVSSPAVVLAADTVVILAAEPIGSAAHDPILGKPVDAAEARAMLRSLRGRAHRVCTAVTICKLGGAPHVVTEPVCTEVHLRPYSDREIEAYVATGDPFDKAGSYAIQHRGFHPVEHIAGCYTNVMGLPLCALRRLLAQIDWPGMAATAVCDCPRQKEARCVDADFIDLAED